MTAVDRLFTCIHFLVATACVGSRKRVREMSVDNSKEKDKVSAHEGPQTSGAGLGGCVQEMHN